MFAHKHRSTEAVTVQFRTTASAQCIVNTIYSRDISPTLAQCWVSVMVAGQTSKPTPGQSVNVFSRYVEPRKIRDAYPNAALTLTRRLRRWANIKTAPAYWDASPTNKTCRSTPSQCWASATDG